MPASISGHGSRSHERAADRRAQTAARVDRVRCVLRHGNRYLLVQPNTSGARALGRWGLAGGRLEPPEEPRAALRRELEEELKLTVPTLIELGNWRHEHDTHRVYGCDVGPLPQWFNPDELGGIRWFTYGDVARLALSSRLHRGFELAAIRTFRLVAAS